ncbi:MAG TPA: hypothetical protein PKD37_07220 [Oligoflexia bacterium]|nr:hypothetical protein [Oligoflexia bacterium]HMP27753.1 hypothetical protein [Oligoflexia bacterium]
MNRSKLIKQGGTRDRQTDSKRQAEVSQAPHKIGWHLSISTALGKARISEQPQKEVGA